MGTRPGLDRRILALLALLIALGLAFDLFGNVMWPQPRHCIERRETDSQNITPFDLTGDFFAEWCKHPPD